MNSIKQGLARAAKKTALVSAALVLFLTGLAFLTAAAWIALAAAFDSLTAATVIGSAYVGAGLIALALAMAKPQSERTSRPQHAAPRPATAEGAPPLVQAFIVGLQTGLSGGARRN